MSAQAKALFKEWYDKLADRKSIYEALPLNFETGDGIRIADSYGMGERTFKRWLNSSLFKKIDHGYYEKKYR